MFFRPIKKLPATSYAAGLQSSELRPRILLERDSNGIDGLSFSCPVDSSSSLSEKTALRVRLMLFGFGLLLDSKRILLWLHHCCGDFLQRVEHTYSKRTNETNTTYWYSSSRNTTNSSLCHHTADFLDIQEHHIYPH